MLADKTNEAYLLMLLDLVDSTNYKRACLYLTSCSKYVSEFRLLLEDVFSNFIEIKLLNTCYVDVETGRYLSTPDHVAALYIAFAMYMKVSDLVSALRIVLLINDSQVGE